MAEREYREGAHTIYDLKYHLVWVTKCRYKVLAGDVATRARDLLRQVCMTREIKIVKGHVSRDHVHMLVSCPPKLSVSGMVQYLKGRSSHMLQREFPELRRRYWGQHLWARGYFAASSGTVTDAMIKAYIEQQDMPPNDGFTVADEKL
jgi:putative transposase